MGSVADLVESPALEPLASGPGRARSFCSHLAAAARVAWDQGAAR
jgi:hypothetical protein